MAQGTVKVVKRQESFGFSREKMDGWVRSSFRHHRNRL